MDVVKFAQMLYKEIDEEVQDIRVRLGRNMAKDMPDYRYMTGQIIALERQRERVKEISQSDEDEEDDNA